MARVELFGRCLTGTVTLAIVFSLIPSLTGAQALRFQPQGVAAAGQGNALTAQAGDLGGSISLPPPSHFYLSANLGVLRLKSLT